MLRFSMLSFSLLIISQIRFISTVPALTVYLPLTAFTMAYYVISLFVNAGTRDFDMRAHRRRVRDWQSRPGRPTLDILLPVCGEPIEVLENTWSNVAKLIAEYPGIARAYVLDDGATWELVDIAARYGFFYGSRPNRGWFKKAGNLHYGLAQSHGEFILILDADFAPRSDLPAELLPYFDDERVAIVQSPQFFRTHDRMSWVERGAGAVQELFYRSVQVSRDQHDGAICVGSCAIYRRRALRQNGGTTLIEHSEDVHTGFDLYRLGWRLRYVPVPLATGLCPADPDSFLTQQYRWCSGSMSLLGSAKFWRTKMPWRTRFCYLSGFCYYLHTAIFTIVGPLIPLTLLALMPDRIRLANYIFIAPAIVYNVLVFPLWHRCRFGLSAYVAKLLYGWAHLIALWDIIFRRQMGWQTTGQKKKKKSRTLRVWIGVVSWNGVTSTVWVGLAVLRARTIGPENVVVILFLGLFAWVVMAMALASKANYRHWARAHQ
jgi:cellulose synthase/poly-beta-1,6-N-acetylglucosamine synthase-like glycosyltransferase